MSLTFHWSRFDELSTRAFFEIARARVAVFVVEQACAYQELDDFDPLAWHLCAMQGSALAAYVRVVAPGDRFAEPSIGRVMTTASFRGQRLGHVLMTEAIRFTEERYPGHSIRIGAQAHLERFYASLGFDTASEPFDEDGIAHIEMVKAAP